MWFAVLIIVFALVYYFLAVQPFNYWKKKGVPYVKPLPFVGNVGPNLVAKKAMSHLFEEAYNAHVDHSRYVGVYQFSSPVLMILDPDLIKKMTVKDFDTFPEHRLFVPEGVDPMWSKNIFAMKGGERWHAMRATLSPSFTSNKLRIMFDLMKECAKQFTDHFQKQDGLVVLEMKDAFTRYTNDVIATTAFGVNCDSLENRENKFYLMGRDATNFTGIRAARFFLSTISPTLTKLLKIGIFSQSVRDFFRGVIKETLRVRQEHGIIRPDMVHLLMEARKGCLTNDDPNPNNKLDSGFAAAPEEPTCRPSSTNTKQKKLEITDDDITAQALIFFLGGFETSSTFMCFASYELAVNPNVQKRLREEVLKTLDDCNGQLTYDGLLGMKYLDMFVSESLRKWPPGSTGDRMSVKPYTIEPKLPGEKLVTLDAGTNILLPFWALHRDPKYFPNPEKFDPERFSDENKHKIKPFTYMPFGTGPRNCIASRFALLEGKLILAEMVSKFEVVPVERTQIPIQISKSSFNILPENGLWLGLKPFDLNS